ncbi:hypothetical protein PRIPAC_81540 [Pristionchus pacificus]|uniref:Fucosyltransferase n=1 Tax=Pristionchus pacificus TaxID=54126 RepID=A0A2A6BEA7_PRIPA|nr:hypothetical protein PRIPAC_81540 [Pristionchus pacificus]|eukprot:PDM64219.1 hypothetical protein PRIPAC_54463 [Pristionchus pacificus]
MPIQEYLLPRLNTPQFENSDLLIRVFISRTEEIFLVLHRLEYIEESEADAILIHSRTINPSDLPRERRSEQVYVWMCHEEPGKCGKGDRSLPSNYFNTSMTNIRDTIGYNYGYGEIVKTNNETVLNRISDEKWSRIMSKKSDLGIAIISNCHTDSKREVYIERLSKIVKFTLRGSCYSDVELCPKSRKDSWDCVTKLFESYYFYFAFENTVCRDYVTEKFFHRLLSNIVPVVLRRQILNGIAPSDSFIAADDFESPEELAAHLLKVSSDPQLYRKYFKWRDSYAVGNFHSIEGNGVCALCRDLHAKKVRSYSDYNARQRYSRNLCESDVGWKLLNNRKLK